MLDANQSPLASTRHLAPGAEDLSPCQSHHCPVFPCTVHVPVGFCCRWCVRFRASEFSMRLLTLLVGPFRTFMNEELLQLHLKASNSSKQQHAANFEAFCTFMRPLQYWWIAYVRAWVKDRGDGNGPVSAGTCFGALSRRWSRTQRYLQSTQNDTEQTERILCNLGGWTKCVPMRL